MHVRLLATRDFDMHFLLFSRWMGENAFVSAQKSITVTFGPAERCV